MYKNPDMKKILVIAFIVSNSISFAQTKLDSVLLNKINNYRNSKGLNALIWNDSLYLVADNQSQYMSLTNEVLHTQQLYDSSILKSFIPQPVFLKRFQKFINRNVPRIVGENLVSHSVLFNADINVDSLAEKLLETWINSPSHNELLLDSTMCEASISNKYIDNLLEVDPETLDMISSNRLYVAFESYTDPTW